MVWCSGEIDHFHYFQEQLCLKDWIKPQQQFVLKHAENQQDLVMTAHLEDKLFFIAVTIGFDFLRLLSGCLAWNKSKRLGCYLQSLLPTAIPCCKYGSQTRFAFYLLQVVCRTRVCCCNTSGVWWSAGATHRYYWCGHAGLGSLSNTCYSHRQNKHCADAFSESLTHTEPEVLDYVVTDWHMLVLFDLVWRLTIFLCSESSSKLSVKIIFIYRKLVESSIGFVQALLPLQFLYQEWLPMIEAKFWTRYLTQGPSTG